MKAINLSDIKIFPVGINNDLQKQVKTFENCNYFEDIFEKPNIAELVQKINTYCLTQKIIGFHYCRAIPEEVISNGLILRTGEDIRNNFLANYSEKFNIDEIQNIKETWERYFSLKNRKPRDNRIFFNFTLNALDNGGAKSLLNFYGGEQVYFPIKDLNGIKEKLSTIGSPIIVKCALDPNMINTFIEHPWGSIAVSTYHRSVNKNASIIDQDGWQNVQVTPENIEIIYL